MNELKLIVKDRTDNQRMLIGAAQPCQQIRHEQWHAPGRRADVMDFATAHNANAGAAVLPGRVQQAEHQNSVRVQQIGLVARIPLPVLVVGFDGVANFLNISQWGSDRFAIENRGNLLLAEGIALNAQRTANRADEIDAPQPQILRDTRRLCPANGFADLFNAKQHVRRD